MSNSPDDAQKPSATDPRLRRFLQRAVPIIAAERGINERSLIRIRAVADDLRLPNELYQSGLRKLKKVGIGQKLTRYEREFNRFLRKEFRDLSGGILTVAIEQKALEIATQKYQIPIERAREIIMERTLKQNIGRISRSEAELHVEQMISDRIQNATFIDVETRKRFYSVGKEWGVERDRVDSIVEQMIAQNREALQAKSRSYLPLYAPFIGAALIALMIACYFVFVRGGGEAGKGNDDPTSAVAKPIQFPEWWPDAAKLDAAKIGSFDPDFEVTLRKLVADDSETRIEGYRLLATRILDKGSSGDEFERASSLAKDLANFETDSAARLEFARLFSDPIIVDRLPANAGEAKRTFVANEVAFHFYQELKPSSPIRPDLASRLELKTGLEPEHPDYLLLSNRAIANAQWRQLESTAWSDPELAYQKLNLVATQSSKHLSDPEFHSRLAETIYGLLEASPEQWQTQSARKWLDVAIERSDRESLVPWIDLAQSTNDESLSTWLNRLLASRLEIEDLPRDRDQALALLRRSATGIEKRESQIASRWSQWEQKLSRNSSVRPITANSIITAQQISDLAYFATLAMILGNDLEHQGMMTFDRLIAEDPPGLQSGSIFSRPGLEFRKPDSGPARTWDIKSKQDLIERIRPESGITDVARANALKQLSKLAGRIADLEPAEAKIVAEYCLSVSNPDQLLVVQQSLAQMSIWLNLTLAFVDAIDSSEMSRQDLVAIFETLTIGPVELDDGKNWKLQLKETLLDFLSSSLEANLSRKNLGGNESWNILAATFRDQYGHRCRSLGAESSSIERARTIPQMQLLLASLLEHPEFDETTRWDQIALEEAALQNLSNTTLEQVVILELRIQKLLIEAADIPESTRKTLLAQLERQSQNLPNLGQKLYFSQYFFCQIAGQAARRGKAGSQ